MRTERPRHALNLDIVAAGGNSTRIGLEQVDELVGPVRPTVVSLHDDLAVLKSLLDREPLSFEDIEPVLSMLYTRNFWPYTEMHGSIQTLNLAARAHFKKTSDPFDFDREDLRSLISSFEKRLTDAAASISSAAGFGELVKAVDGLAAAQRLAVSDHAELVAAWPRRPGEPDTLLERRRTEATAKFDRAVRVLTQKHEETLVTVSNAAATTSLLALPLATFVSRALATAVDQRQTDPGNSVATPGIVGRIYEVVGLFQKLSDNQLGDLAETALSATATLEALPVLAPLSTSSFNDQQSSPVSATLTMLPTVGPYDDFSDEVSSKQEEPWQPAASLKLESVPADVARNSAQLNVQARSAPAVIGKHEDSDTRIAFAVTPGTGQSIEIELKKIPAVGSTVKIEIPRKNGADPNQQPFVVEFVAQPGVDIDSTTIEFERLGRDGNHFRLVKNALLAQLDLPDRGLPVVVSPRAHGSLNGLVSVPVSREGLVQEVQLNGRSYGQLVASRFLKQRIESGANLTDLRSELAGVDLLDLTTCYGAAMAKEFLDSWGALSGRRPNLIVDPEINWIRGPRATPSQGVVVPEDHAERWGEFDSFGRAYFVRLNEVLESCFGALANGGASDLIAASLNAFAAAQEVRSEPIDFDAVVSKIQSEGVETFLRLGGAIVDESYLFEQRQACAALAALVQTNFWPEAKESVETLLRLASDTELDDEPKRSTTIPVIDHQDVLKIATNETTYEQKLRECFEEPVSLEVLNLVNAAIGQLSRLLHQSGRIGNFLSDDGLSSLHYSTHELEENLEKANKVMGNIVDRMSGDSVFGLYVYEFNKGGGFDYRPNFAPNTFRLLPPTEWPETELGIELKNAFSYFQGELRTTLGQLLRLRFSPSITYQDPIRQISWTDIASIASRSELGAEFVSAVENLATISVDQGSAAEWAAFNHEVCCLLTEPDLGERLNPEVVEARMFPPEKPELTSLIVETLQGWQPKNPNLYDLSRRASVSERARWLDGLNGASGDSWEINEEAEHRLAELYDNFGSWNVATQLQIQQKIVGLAERASPKVHPRRYRDLKVNFEDLVFCAPPRLSKQKARWASEPDGFSRGPTMHLEGSGWTSVALDRTTGDSTLIDTHYGEAYNHLNLLFPDPETNETIELEGTPHIDVRRLLNPQDGKWSLNEDGVWFMRWYRHYQAAEASPKKAELIPAAAVTPTLASTVPIGMGRPLSGALQRCRETSSRVNPS